jgi:hypothetical protein
MVRFLHKDTKRQRFFQETLHYLLKNATFAVDGSDSFIFSDAPGIGRARAKPLSDARGNNQEIIIKIYNAS